MERDLPIAEIPLCSEELDERFAQLQRRLVPLWQLICEVNGAGEQTIVVVPSLTVEFGGLRGSVLQAYEERFLFLLFLLRQPRARLVYVTSQPVVPSTVDYYLSLLPGVIPSHARARLHLITPHDGAPRPLVHKLLQRPRLIERIRELIPDPTRAHLVPFNTTRHERDLALRLGIPMYGADPCHTHLGTKSGSRALFRRCGVSCPAGMEGIRSRAQLVDALVGLMRERPACDEWMIKHDDGVSGEGNAVLSVRGLTWRDPDEIDARLASLQLEAENVSVPAFLEKLFAHGGVVEERISGIELTSPSVQLRVTPLGDVEVLSTHDQILGGAQGQKFLGCAFPADPRYASEIARQSRRVGEALASIGVIGRFSIDFVCHRDEIGWHSYAIELNLRKGGTTHPYLTLHFLTDGRYDPEAGIYHTVNGAKFYVATDALESPSYRVFTPTDLFDIVVRRGLHYDQIRQTGVVLHMMTAVGDMGRLGFTAVGESAAQAHALFVRMREVLDEEATAALMDRALPELHEGGDALASGGA